MVKYIEFRAGWLEKCLIGVRWRIQYFTIFKYDDLLGRVIMAFATNPIANGAHATLQPKYQLWLCFSVMFLWFDQALEESSCLTFLYLNRLIWIITFIHCGYWFEIEKDRRIIAAVILFNGLIFQLFWLWAERILQIHGRSVCCCSFALLGQLGNFMYYLWLWLATLLYS